MIAVANFFYVDLSSLYIPKRAHAENLSKLKLKEEQAKREKQREVCLNCAYMYRTI